MVDPGPSLSEALAAAGFSLRTIHVLLDEMKLEAIGDLNDGEWGSPNEPGCLAYYLTAFPKLGAMGVAEVEAFRTTGDARNVKPLGPTLVATRLNRAEIEALDRWAKHHGVARSQAAHTFIVDGLARQPENE